MKIIIINGSPRTPGFTAALLHGMEETLKQKGVEVDFFDLGKLTMAQCAGCCACYTTGHCHLNDDAERLSLLIKDADGLILGSPTYASNVSGLMKLLIDRGHFVIEQLLTGKYCVTVATGENYGNRDASKVLKKLVLYSGGRLTRSIAMNAPFNSITITSEKKTNLNEPATTASLQISMISRKVADHLYTAISKKKKNPIQKLHHAVIFSFGIKPFVKRKGSKYKGVLNKWKELGIYG